MKTLFIFSLLSTGLLLGACPESEPRACTAIGCVNGLRVEFQKISGWQPGKYEFKTNIDGAAQSCTVTLPFPSCNLPNPCKSDDVIVEQSGCALPSSEHLVSGISTTKTNFKELAVEVLRDGNSIGKQSFRPTFTTSQPNGVGCEPTCSSAPNASMQLN
jgi:hypothetical protein